MTRRPLKVAAVVPYPVGWAAGQRFRIEQWFDSLGERRVEVTYHPLLSAADYRRIYAPGAAFEKGARVLRGLVRRVGQLDSVTTGDVVVVYREAFPFAGPVFESRIAARRPLVFDFDDAIWLADTSRHNAWVRPLKRPEKVATIAKLAATTTVGNDYLADYVRGFGAEAQVIPTTLDVDRYRPPAAKSARSTRVRIGWSGSPTTSGYLAQIGPVLRRVLERGDVELWVVGDPRFRLDGAPNVTVLPWSREAEIETVGSFDIGIMPLPDNRWTRGKCGFKALLYMSLGVATVASPVGVNRAIVEPGRNGLLASASEEWESALNELVDDAARRRDLARAGRETVVDGYSTRRWAPVFYEVLSAAGGRGR